MIIDARSVPKGKTIETDVCIIGAGAAGITLAREFIGQSFRVCLLESGGFEFDEDTQSLCDGETIGLPYTPLKAARVRYFGGTTNHWHGWCRPLDEIDFESRDWIPHSGWPFGKSHLFSFYERAQSICQLKPVPYDVKFWEAETASSLPFASSRVNTAVFRFSPPTRFGEVYRDQIARARNISTYLHANVTEIDNNEHARTVTRLRVTCLPGNQFWVSATIFILAAGGIENARLLLLSNKLQSAGLGNQNDLVGRFFMDHVGVASGAVILSDPDTSTVLYESERRVDLMAKIDGGSMEKFLNQEEKETITSWIRAGAKQENYPATVKPILEKNCVTCHMAGGIAYFSPLTSYPQVRSLVTNIDGYPVPQRSNELQVKGALTLAAETQRREKLANYCTVMWRMPWSKSMQADGFRRTLSNVISHIDYVAAAIYQIFFKGKVKPRGFGLYNIFEPAPNPQSRVVLSSERDRLGQNRVQLRFTLSPTDKRTIRRSQEIIGRELGCAGLGRWLGSTTKMKVGPRLRSILVATTWEQPVCTLIPETVS